MDCLETLASFLTDEYNGCPVENKIRPVHRERGWRYVKKECNDQFLILLKMSPISFTKEKAPGAQVAVARTQVGDKGLVIFYDDGTVQANFFELRKLFREYNYL